MAGRLNRVAVITDSADLEVPADWRHQAHVSVHRGNPLRPETWAGLHTYDVVVACISEDTANNAVVREVLRGYPARVYVRVE